MRYCINPSCSLPQNSDNLMRCQACGSSLIYDELLYRAIRPLDTQDGHTTEAINNTRLYEVADNDGNLAVLKVLTNNSSKLVELFERQTQILRELSHTGIPRFYRAFIFVTRNGTQLHCLVLEKIEGQNLDQWLKYHGSLSQNIALYWLKQLVYILYLVQINRLITQDIKHSNIMRKHDEQLVLIDLSNVPEIVSAGYTPREQADGKAVPQSDFFALGRTFVHLLTGKHPIDLPKDRETKKLIWRPHAPQVSQPLADLIDDLMAPLPEQRPQNAPAILHKLT